MSQIQLKTVARKKALLISLPISLVLLVAYIYFVPFLELLSKTQGLIIAAFLGILAIITIPYFILLGSTGQTIDVDVTKNNVQFREDGNLSIVESNNIALIKHVKLDAMSEQIRIYNSTGKIEKSLSLLIRDQKPEKFIRLLVEEYALLTSEMPNKNGIKEKGTYTNRLVAVPATLQQVVAIQKKSKVKYYVICAVVFVVLMSVLLLPFFINPKAFYDVRDNKVYFGSKQMPSVNANEFRTIDYDVAKDSSHIYFHENEVPYIDYKTFRSLGSSFYGDKNGIYYVTTGLYSKHKLAKVKGEFDEATFQSLDVDDLYKDKNKLYMFQPFKNPPLTPVDVPGIDLATLKPLFSYWLQDKNKIYFYQFVGRKIKECPEIDRNTFSQVSDIVAKDKNHVYYITFHLESKDKKATDNIDYAILTNADPETFKAIDEDHYEDKNRTWTIKNEK